MTPYPIYAQTGPLEWWQILTALGPWILLLTAGVVGFIWWLALRKETKDVTRNDQWARTVWALEASVDTDPKKRRAGRAVLDLLNRGAVADSDVTKILAQAPKGNSAPTVEQ